MTPFVYLLFNKKLHTFLSILYLKSNCLFSTNLGANFSVFLVGFGIDLKISGVYFFAKRNLG